MPKDEPNEAMKDNAHWLIEHVDSALADGDIDEAEWHRQISQVITSAYLAAETPWGQSGKSGDERNWSYARSLICDALNRDGSFLDVGCANGYLMECLQSWAADRGLCIEPHGLEISPQLADLARSRLTGWADRIHTGNVMTWAPPQRFDFVRTGLEYVPARRRRDLVNRIVDELVSENGRIIIGTYYGVRAGPDETEQEISSWGFDVAGHTSRPHEDDCLTYRVMWIDA